MFKHFLEDEQFNFQINRIASYGPLYMNESEIRKEFLRIKDIESWTLQQ